MTTYLVLRRYDVLNKDHFVQNEGPGSGRITAAALRFEASDSREGWLELSIYNRDILLSNGFEEISLVEGLAEGYRVAHCENIEVLSATTEDTPNYFSIEPDPYPDGEEKGKPFDVAHEVVLLPPAVSNGLRRKLVKVLASKFQVSA